MEVEVTIMTYEITAYKDDKVFTLVTTQEGLKATLQRMFKQGFTEIRVRRGDRTVEIFDIGDFLYVTKSLN
jgi:hypothetical protein